MGKQAVQHVFLIGAKGLGQYGGYETFVQKLVSTHAEMKQDGICYHVACKEGVLPASGDPEAERVRVLGEREYAYCGAHCFVIHVPDIGAAQAIWYDVAALKYAFRYCREHHIEHPVFYILACRIGVLIGGMSRRISALGGRLYINPDGHEWMRAKWSAPVRRYWKYSEKRMVKASDLVVCDSRQMEIYIREEYSRYKPRTVFIPYGADARPSALADDDPSFVEWMNQNGVESGGYYLVVCRLVPENSFETILSEFMKSRTKKKLILITTQEKKFYQALREKLHFETDDRIRFAGALYNRELLMKVREKAYAYIHGHTVGGTNPTLLEAMSSTWVNLLVDVSFNREVGEDAALYWSTQPGSLSGVIDKADAMSEEERSALGSRARARIRDAYRWDQVTEQYSLLFSGVKGNI